MWGASRRQGCTVPRRRKGARANTGCSRLRYRAACRRSHALSEGLVAEARARTRAAAKPGRWAACA